MNRLQQTQASERSHQDASVPRLCLTLLLIWTDLHGSTQCWKIFGLVRLRQKLHSNGTAPLSPMAWSFFNLNGVVSASLAGGDVFMTCEGMAEM